VIATVSAIGVRGKKSSCNTLQVSPEVAYATESFFLMKETSEMAMAAVTL